MIKIIGLYMILGCILSEDSTACPDNEYCLNCSEDNKTCDSCQDSYPGAEGVCTVPTTIKDNCLTYTDNGQCSGCAWGYYLSSNSCVENTIENCLLQSMGDDNTALCLGCKDNYAVIDNKCSEDTECTGNCSYCIKVGEAETCVWCKEDYILHANACKSATGKLANCMQTKDGTNCISCMFGYYDKDGTCTESSKTNKVSGSGVYSLIFVSLFSFIFSF